jgi:segregation and condensation protein B
MTLKKIIEALVFASQKPLLPHEIVNALRSAGGEEDAEAREFSKVKEAEVAAALEELKAGYIEAGHAFSLVDQVNGWHVVTVPECGKWVRQLYPESKPARLSGPALETLAIVAYRQPITKADIEAVRGVAVDGMMQTLLEKGLIRIAGRAEVPGRPLLYETTEHFLEHFGLRGVDELPNSAELRRANLPSASAEKQAPKDESAAVENRPDAPELPLTEGQAPAEPASEPGAAAEAEELPAVEDPPAGATENQSQA